MRLSEAKESFTQPSKALEHFPKVFGKALLVFANTGREKGNGSLGILMGNLYLESTGKGETGGQRGLLELRTQFYAFNNSEASPII